MKLKIVAVAMLMTGVVVTGLLTTNTAVAQKNDHQISMQNFTADEQRAMVQGGRATNIVMAEAPQAAGVLVAAPSALSNNDSGTWSVPAAIWLAASGLAGMGLLQRRKK